MFRFAENSRCCENEIPAFAGMGRCLCIIANAMMKRMLCKIVRYPAVAWILRESSSLLKIPLGWLVVVFAASLLWVMLFTADGGVFARLLDANSKNEAIKFIGLGMSGALAVIIALALNRRAAAQDKSAAAMVKNNELIEKGHIDERFKAAVQSLGSEQPSVRIAAFYQFYHLAKGNPDKDFINNVFDILCAHLRQITSKEEYRNGEGQEKPTEECQSLLDVLFKNQEIFSEMHAQLGGVYLVGADFSCANIQFAILMDANLQNSRFYATRAGGASFFGANIKGAAFGRTSLHQSDMYWADNLDQANFHDPIELNSSDVPEYPDWFEEGKHYVVDDPE